MDVVKRPTVLHPAPRQWVFIDVRREALGPDFRFWGLLCIAAALIGLLFAPINFQRDPYLPTTLVGAVVIGILIIIRSPTQLRRFPLLRVNLSRGVFFLPKHKLNGSGETETEHLVEEVDELLFAMRSTPLNPKRPEGASIDAFAVYIRMFDGELLPVIEACVDQDRTFNVARALRDAFGVGIKQVGKGYLEPQS